MRKGHRAQAINGGVGTGRIRCHLRVAGPPAKRVRSLFGIKVGSEGFLHSEGHSGASRERGASIAGANGGGLHLGRRGVGRASGRTWEPGNRGVQTRTDEPGRCLLSDSQFPEVIEVVFWMRDRSLGMPARHRMAAWEPTFRRRQKDKLFSARFFKSNPLYDFERHMEHVAAVLYRFVFIHVKECLKIYLTCQVQHP